MKTRALLECTIDTANPAGELTAVISVVLGSLPEGQRLALLHTLDEEIGRALAEYEVKPEGAAA